MERKLASIRRIADIQPIENADAIEVATVDGWQVVVKKGEFAVGDLAVYAEIDSWIPHDLASFLSKGKEPREYNGVKGERLRTIKLRGQVSQGLLINPEDVPRCVFGTNLEHTGDPMNFYDLKLEEGMDVTEILGVQKWEAPIPVQLAGKAKGNFPTDLIPKTDQERIQNCFGTIQKRDGKFLTEKVWNEELKILEEKDVVLPDDFQKPTYEVTLKLDGSSMTVFRWESELRVCSRNLELQINDDNADNSFVQMAMKLGDQIPEGFAFQGELMAPGIQGNREGFKEARFFVFDIFDIKEHKYVKPGERRSLCHMVGLEHVPSLGVHWEAPNSVVEGLELAEGPSINHKVREGLVWKCNEDPTFSFKTISNKFLLKGGD